MLLRRREHPEERSAARRAAWRQAARTVRERGFPAQAGERCPECRRESWRTPHLSEKRG